LSKKKILVSLLPLLIGTGVWLKDGARVAFWLTSVEEKKEIPIVDGMPEVGTQTQIVWREQFVSGVESPLIGFFLTLTLFLLIKQGLGKKNSNDM
jgi:hypothetical protein